MFFKFFGQFHVAAGCVASVTGLVLRVAGHSEAANVASEYCFPFLGVGLLCLILHELRN